MQSDSEKSWSSLLSSIKVMLIIGIILIVLEILVLSIVYKDLSKLSTKQELVKDIITSYVDKKVNNEPVDPLRLFVYL